MRTGTANLPLHGHHCPRWLFNKMVKLSTAIVEAVVEEFGPHEVLRRLSDPFWFQALGSVAGFDWHSSGLTTVLCGALKKGLKPRQKDLGLFLAGGKAMASRKTPFEIEDYADKYALGIDVPTLQYTSRLTAKVDNACVQDGYQIYHHVFAFTADGNWAVVQQGMNQRNAYARRYHWLSDTVADFVNEPHNAVCGTPQESVLNMVAEESAPAREVSVFVTGEKPERNIRDIKKIGELNLPRRHSVPQTGRIQKALLSLYDTQPKTYEDILAIKGVGPATIRALALVAEVVYGTKASFKDPAKYSFAHGGKDGYPYPVNRKDYDKSISTLETALRRARLGQNDSMKALRKLASISEKVGVKL